MSKVTHKAKRARSPRKRASIPQVAPVMSQRELARLGGGEIAYIKVLTSEEAQRLYPMIEGLPSGMNLYALHAADGTPIALTDSRQAAIGHARGDKLEIASVH
jgi:hypothetical protein